VKTKLPFALIVLCATSALAQQNDWLIVPGKRLGPITSDTTRADLDRIFGKAGVQDQPVDSGEGPEPATVVFPKSPSGALAIFWQEDNRMDRVTICYQQHEAGPCKWHTASGVSLGTNLQQLEALNGRAFQIEPWGYDLGGNISSWRGGKLAGFFGDGVSRKLLLAVYIQEKSLTPEERKLFDEINRQKSKPLSSDPAVRQLHPTVTRMEMIFPGKD